MHYGHCICLKWDESFHPVKQAAFDLQQKETGSKTVAIAIAHCQQTSSSLTNTECVFVSDSLQ